MEKKLFFIIGTNGNNIFFIFGKNGKKKKEKKMHCKTRRTKQFGSECLQ